MHVFLYKNQQMFGSKQLKSKKFRGPLFWQKDTPKYSSQSSMCPIDKNEFKIQTQIRN